MLLLKRIIMQVSKDYLTISIPEKSRNSIFKIPIVPQTLSINNQRTTSTKSINLDITRKPIKYSLKKAGLKTTFTLTVFEILLLKVGQYYHPREGYLREGQSISKVITDVTKIMPFKYQRVQQCIIDFSSNIFTPINVLM